MKRILTFALLLAATTGCIWAQNKPNNPDYKLPDEKSSLEYRDLGEFDRGFWIAGELMGGYSCFLSGDRNAAPLELDVVGGYRFNQYARVGLGLGARYYFRNDHLRQNNLAWAFPVYLNVRGNIIPEQYREVVPYYSFDIGGAIQDGFMWRPTIGIRVGQPRSAFLLGLSYMGQCMKVQPYNKNSYASFVMLRLGYEF